MLAKMTLKAQHRINSNKKKDCKRIAKEAQTTGSEESLTWFRSWVMSQWLQGAGHQAADHHKVTQHLDWPFHSSDLSCVQMLWTELQRELTHPQHIQHISELK